MNSPYVSSIVGSMSLFTSYFINLNKHYLRASSGMKNVYCKFKDIACKEGVDINRSEGRKKSI